MATITTLTGGNFQTPDGTLLQSGSTITFQLSNPAQVTGNDAQLAQDYTVTYGISAGDIQSGATIWANSQLTPSGTYYRVNIYNQNGQLIRGPENWVLSGSSPIDLGTIVATTPSVAYSGAVLLNPSGNQIITSGNLTIDNGLDVVGNLSKISEYNGTLTAGNGIPGIIGQVLASGLVANYNSGTAATIVASTPSAGQYRITTDSQVQNTPSGATLPSLTLTYTDVAGIGRTDSLWSSISSISSDATQSGTKKVWIIYSEAAAAIQITSASYAAGSGTAMSYYLSVTVEQL
jgi:hypothetical protein